MDLRASRLFRPQRTVDPTFSPHDLTDHVNHPNWAWAPGLVPMAYMRWFKVRGISSKMVLEARGRGRKLAESHRMY